MRTHLYALAAQFALIVTLWPARSGAAQAPKLPEIDLGAISKGLQGLAARAKTASVHASRQVQSGVHPAWRANKQFWTTKWEHANNHLKKSPAVRQAVEHLRKTAPKVVTHERVAGAQAVWRNHVPVLSTYREDVAKRLGDPKHAAKLTLAAAFRKKNDLKTEAVRLIPVYSPVSGEVHTLDHIARHIANELDKDGHLEGSEFKEDPVGCVASTIMCDPAFLMRARVLRQKNGEWISVQDALIEKATQGVGQDLKATHAAALDALSRGDYATFHAKLEAFGKSVRLVNAASYRTTGNLKVASLLSSPKIVNDIRQFEAQAQKEEEDHKKKRKQLATKEGPSPYDLERQLEGAPKQLLAQAEQAKKLGRIRVALDVLQKLADTYPHSGYADDALLGLAIHDFEEFKFEAAAEKLEGFLDHYYMSDLTPKALYFLARSYDGSPAQTDAQRAWAVRNYKTILKKYESDKTDWKQEVIQLAAKHHKAVEVYRILLRHFPGSPYAHKAQRRLKEIGEAEKE